MTDVKVKTKMYFFKWYIKVREVTITKETEVRIQKIESELFSDHLNIKTYHVYCVN